MANVAISDLAAITSLAAGDLIMVTDDSEAASEKSKKATITIVEKRIRPPGEIAAFMLSSAPQGWLACDGSAVSRTTYANLFAVLSTVFGAGDGSTTFNVPDLRGYFLRGYDNGAGNDPDAASRTDRGDGTSGDNIGTVQDDEFALHGHPTRIDSKTGTVSMDGNGGMTLNNAKDETYDAYTGTPDETIGQQVGGSGGNETRPINISVLYCVKV